MQPTIVLIAPKHDAQVSTVHQELQRHAVPIFCCDLADFPTQLTLSARLGEGRGWEGLLTDLDQPFLDLSTIGSIWNRRRGPEPYLPGSRIIDYGKLFVRDEARKGMDGLWKSLPCFWVNHPDANWAAESKPSQLALAQSFGLNVPKTLLTNDATAAEHFFEECKGEVIYKTLGRNTLSTPEGNRYIFTNRVTRADALHFHEVSTTAHLFQELFPKKLELRITIIGATLFAAEIYSQQVPEAQIDFRRSYGGLRYGVHTLPRSVEEALFRLMRQLRLEYAAIDMVLQPDGHYIFLELNPMGQYGWIEEETHLPLSQTLAALLVGKAPRLEDVHDH